MREEDEWILSLKTIDHFTHYVGIAARKQPSFIVLLLYARSSERVGAELSFDSASATCMFTKLCKAG